MADIPLINGTRHEWSSIEIKIGVDTWLGVTEVTYSDTLEPTKVYGAHAQPIGRTRGKYEAEGGITLLLSEAEAIRTKLGDGFKEEVFDIVVAYSDAGEQVITHEIVGCRIKHEEPGGLSAGGSDAITVKWDLDVMLIRWNGKESLKKPLGAAAAA